MLVNDLWHLHQARFFKFARADLDADGTSHETGKVGITLLKIDVGDHPVLLHHGRLIKRLPWTREDALLACLAERAHILQGVFSGGRHRGSIRRDDRKPLPRTKLIGD